MPIRILSLPDKDLQYAINSMNIFDLIAFSLCSKQTKNLVKSSSRKIEQISAKFDGNEIKLRMNVVSVQGCFHKRLKCVLREDSLIEQYPGLGILRKQGFTQRDWIAHFLSLSTSSIYELKIENIPSVAYFNTFKQLIPICRSLRINCSIEVTRCVVSKLSSIPQRVEIHNDRFDNQNHLTEFLNLNSKTLYLESWRTPFKVELNDLLLANSIYLTISTAIITDRELNRFLKIWMKSNHRFYRPKYIKLFLKKEIIHEELFGGVKNQIFGHERRLTRGDGKELFISIRWKTVVFEFQ
ncbi:hypothetical protein B9Z55_021603 [Caenorhabditis nigoni]|nr:hypothetical protein B9Z55_021603 [Caenorhabditis nigoni]